MNDESRRDGIAKELHHSARALEAARLLRDAALYNDALSRLYYALFHAAVALLLSAGIEPRRQRALPHLLGTHFPGVMSASDIAQVSRAATYRDLADYERTWEATDEIATDAFAVVEALVGRIREHLAAGHWLP